MDINKAKKMDWGAPWPDPRGGEPGAALGLRLTPWGAHEDHLDEGACYKPRAPITFQVP